MQTNLQPANELAVVRTTLANERTLLSYFRISLGSFIGAAGLIRFLNVSFCYQNRLFKTKIQL